MRPLIQPDWVAVAAGASGTQALATTAGSVAAGGGGSAAGGGGSAAGGGRSAAGGGEAAAGDGEGCKARPFTLWPNAGGGQAGLQDEDAHAHSWWSADGSLGGATQEEIDARIRRANVLHNAGIPPVFGAPAEPPPPGPPRPPPGPPPPGLLPPPPPPPTPLSPLSTLFSVPREVGDSPWGGRLRLCEGPRGGGCGFFLYGKGQCLNPFCNFHRKRKSNR